MSDGDWERQEAVVCNRDGLHARPISRLVEISLRFKSNLKISRDSVEVDGRSILQLLTLAAPKGTRLVLRAVGPDAQGLLAALKAEIDRGFGEELN